MSCPSDDLRVGSCRPFGPARVAASSRNTASSATNPAACTHASSCCRVVVIPATNGASNVANVLASAFAPSVPVPFSALLVIGGSFGPGSGTLSWPTRFSGQPRDRHYSVLKFNRDRDIPEVDVGETKKSPGLLTRPYRGFALARTRYSSSHGYTTFLAFPPRDPTSKTFPTETHRLYIGPCQSFSMNSSP